MSKVVLQKVIAASGFYSRHEAEKLIAAGRVVLNNKLGKLGDRADENDLILVDNKRLPIAKEFSYLKLYKPVDYVCTTKNFPGEKNIFSLLKTKKVLSIVGRLDKDSEGLVLLTNDGELAYRLTHPKFGVKKVYVVTLSHDLGSNRFLIRKKAEELNRKFKSGVNIGLGDGLVKAERLKYLRGRTLEVVLGEGKKRQVRRMFRQLNCHVERLVRVRIGNVTVGGLRKGSYKSLTKEEIQKLKTLVSL